MNTARPVGMCVARQADSILLTAWPPGPLERVNWYLMSLGSTSNVKGTTGITTIDIVLECSLPFDSVSGTRITLCTPASHFSILWQPSPCTRMSSALNPRLTPDYLTAVEIQLRQPCMEQKDSYISLMSCTKMELQAPPAPGRNSRMISSALSQGAAGTIIYRHSSLSSVSLQRASVFSLSSSYFYYLSLVYFSISSRSWRLRRRDLICSLRSRIGACCEIYILICYLVILMLKEGFYSDIDVQSSATQSARCWRAFIMSLSVCSEFLRGLLAVQNWWWLAGLRYGGEVLYLR